MQLWWEDAWWEATLLEELALQGDGEGQGERAEPPARARVRLRGAAALVGAPQSVVCGQLRPAWEWRLVEGAQGYGEWVAPCIAPVGVVAAGKPDGGTPPPCSFELELLRPHGAPLAPHRPSRVPERRSYFRRELLLFSRECGRHDRGGRVDCAHVLHNDKSL